MVPDFNQLLILTLALVPGFVAIQVQSFVSLAKATPTFDKTLIALGYSAALYLLASLGSWGPQYSPALGRVVGGSALSLVEGDLLLRYLALLGVAATAGLIVGRSLVSGPLREVVSLLTGRNVIAVTWEQYFRDRPGKAVYVHLANGQGVAGVPVASSAGGAERTLILAYPKWVLGDGSLLSMNMAALLLDVSTSRYIGEILPTDLNS